MATINLKRSGRNSEKRGVTVAVGTLNPAVDGTFASGDDVYLVGLPKGSSVTGAFLTVRDAVSGGTQTITLKSGANTVLAATAVGTTKGVKTGTVTAAYTGGSTVNLTATIGTADLTDGIVDCVVEYIENDLVTGDLTRVEI